MSPTRNSISPIHLQLAGASAALAIPLVYLLRHRRSTLRNALSSSNPRRRAVSSSACKPSYLPPGRGAKSVLHTDGDLHLKGPPQSESSTLSTRELLSAISTVDYGTAVYGAKAFVAATALVGMVGVVLREMVGVRDVRIIIIFRFIHRVVVDMTSGADRSRNAGTLCVRLFRERTGRMVLRMKECWRDLNLPPLAGVDDT